MQVSQHITDGTATLSLSGRFDFNAHRDFRDAYEALMNTSGIQALDIDLGGVDYLDSSALGMLLLVKERAAARNIRLQLSGCKGAVRQILDIANFGKLFTIV